MPQVLTDAGAKIFVQLVTGNWTFEEIVAELWVMLLAAQPPLDRTKTAVSDYVPAGSKASPLDWTLTFEEVTGPAIVNGRAVVQWGPPGLTFNVLESFTCWGFLVGGADDQVLWVDRFDTPQVVAMGGFVTVVPAIAITSEYPPLGGGT